MNNRFQETSKSDSIRQRLKAMADEKYRAFAVSLVPECDLEFLGVRLPMLRKMARDIAKNDFRSFLAETPGRCFEEIMLRGMVIGCARMGLPEKLDHVATFVPLVTNWSICDSFCTGLKFTRDHRERVWDFLQPYLVSNDEFQVRFAVVMLLNHYIEEAWLDRVLSALDKIRHGGYYARMAVAWAVSICYVTYPERTQTYLDTCHLDDVTFNMALRKITESLRVDKTTKDMIRKMRR